MGVDCSLFVLASFSDPEREGYVYHSFRLNRRREQWDLLGAVPKRQHWPQVQVPRGGHTTYEGGEVPDGFEDRERGYLSGNPYGDKLYSCKGRDLPQITGGGLNGNILDFVRENFADLDVIIFWS